MDRAPPPIISTDRYTRKKGAIIAAATGILNRRGVKGMTLADVAASVDLITTSVTYYFKKKEDLAVACFLGGIARLDHLIALALHEPTPHARLKRFLTLYLEMNRRIRLAEEPPLAIFSDIRALKEPYQSTVLSQYEQLFRKVRSLFDAAEHDWLDRRARNARTHLIMEQIYWTGAWLGRYDIEDYPRVGERLFDILTHGMAPAGTQWAVSTLPEKQNAGAPVTDPQRETFLLAATALINQQGYRGASVEKISAKLNVTKGSFYHHNETKDDLVVACFERTFSIMRRVQLAAMNTPGSQWEHLAAAATTLVDFQVSDGGPLLRTSAISALPESIRQDIVARWSRISDRFGAMISDGIAEGSVRAVDPVIAAHMLNAALNAPATATRVIQNITPEEATALYAKPMLMGVFAR